MSGFSNRKIDAIRINMKVVTLKSFFWFFTIPLIAFSFPIQVFLNSPLPSLFSYMVLGIILLLTLVQKSLANDLFKWDFRKTIEKIIAALVILVFFQSGWQILFGYITIEMGVSSLIIFVLPVIYYIYFRNALTEKELRAIFFSMAIAGLLVGAYFAYDSISKLVFGVLPDYALKAREYSLNRGGGPIQGYSARIDMEGRSMGLLEKHAVSSAWITFGCFAGLALLPRKANGKRAFIMSIYGILLVIGMNFTGIFGFLLAIFLIELHGYKLFLGTVSRRSINILLGFLIIFTIIALFITSAFGSELVKIIQKFVDTQYEIAVGKKVIYKGTQGFFGGMFSELIAFPANMMKKFPPGILIGDGFSPGWHGKVDKGGDYGFIETMYRLGPPMFLFVVFGLITLVRRSIRQIRTTHFSDGDNSHLLQFASSVVVYLLFSELHYTVWSAKSIFPVFFLCLAIYSRYLHKTIRKTSDSTSGDPDN